MAVSLEVLTCQSCGREVLDSEEARKARFVEEHLNFRDVRIVRCPNHTSAWAMRISKAASTKANREKARVGKTLVFLRPTSFDPERDLGATPSP